MSRILAEVLATDIVTFTHTIEAWEAKTGKKGHDVALHADLSKRSKLAAAGLGLDPSDSSVVELYFALQERARHDNARLESALKISPEASGQEVINTLLKWVEKKSPSPNVWSVKPAVIRNILKKQPPKNTMKALGLRSVDSMLKRNSSLELLVLVQYFESPQWYKKFLNGVQKLQPKDFQLQKMEVVVCDEERSKRLHKAGFPMSRYVSPQYLCGGLYIIPPKQRFPLDSLALLLSICEAIYDIRKHSVLFRILSVRKDFGVQLAAIMQHGIGRASLEISEIGWNSLHRHLIGNEYVAEMLDQPHVAAEDLLAESALDFLVKHDQEFAYWKDLEFTLIPTNGQPVSMNLLDVVVNASNRHPLSAASASYARMRLWEELWARYLQSPHVIDDVIDAYLRP